MLEKILAERFWPSKKKVKDEYLPILEVLCDEGKKNQYAIEKSLKKPKYRQDMSHSTVTYRLERILKPSGLVIAEKGRDGLTYYGITPFGIAILVMRGRLKISQAIDYFADRPLEYYELLARLQPSLKEHLEKAPSFVVDQVTEDLFLFYHLGNRTDLRKAFLENTLRGTRQFGHFRFEVVPFCRNRIEVEGKIICTKQRKPCNITKEEIPFKCDLIRKQMEDELERLYASKY